MPYIIRPRQIHRIAAGFISSVLLLCAAPALAHASCAAKTTSKAFAQWGDQAPYTLVEGGLFESGVQNWSLGGAAVVSESPEEENGNYNFADESGNGSSHALQIPAGAAVVSAPFCVDSTYPSFRFLVRRVDGQYDSSRLDVSLRWADSQGTHETADASLQAHRDWTITPVLALASKLPAGGAPNVRLVFQPRGATFAIDDVYADPYSR